MALYFPVSSTKITSYFGTRTTNIAGASTDHKGIDIGVVSGTAVKAAQSGIVTATGYNSTSGNYVKIQDSAGLGTFYGHLSSVLVSKGQTVNAGDTIAYSGNTGVSSGAHLHFGVYVNGEAVDPLQQTYTNAAFNTDTSTETATEDTENSGLVIIAVAVGAAAILAFLFK